MFFFTLGNICSVSRPNYTFIFVLLMDLGKNCPRIFYSSMHHHASLWKWAHSTEETFFHFFKPHNDNAFSQQSQFPKMRVLYIKFLKSCICTPCCVSFHQTEIFQNKKRYLLQGQALKYTQPLSSFFFGLTRRCIYFLCSIHLTCPVHWCRLFFMYVSAAAAA